MRNLTVNEHNILEYLLQNSGWVSPSELGMYVGGKYESGALKGLFRHSAWASPICKRLVKKGLIKRSKNGHYKAIISRD